MRKFCPGDDLTEVLAEVAEVRERLGSIVKRGEVVHEHMDADAFADPGTDERVWRDYDVCVVWVEIPATAEFAGVRLQVPARLPMRMAIRRTGRPLFLEQVRGLVWDDVEGRLLPGVYDTLHGLEHPHSENEVLKLRRSRALFGNVDKTLHAHTGRAKDTTDWTENGFVRHLRSAYKRCVERANGRRVAITDVVAEMGVSKAQFYRYKERWHFNYPPDLGET